MKAIVLAIAVILFPTCTIAQDLSTGLLVNDLSLRPMTEKAKPNYLDTIIDPSFGTTIRRISNASPGEAIVPMYSTIQAWNADESYMILYQVGTGYHELLNGISYEFIRVLDDVNPLDLEQLFWDFNDPDILYYPESQTNDFIRYNVSTQAKEILVNLATISNCNAGISLGNDLQMMSWDSDVLTFRCGNETAYSYRISNGELTTINLTSLNYTAPAVSPGGELYYHNAEVYSADGNLFSSLNLSSVEHSCVGKLANDNDAYFAIAFAEGPQGGCIGDIIAHDLTTGNCFPVISQSQGYDYPQSGTHISALAHKNTDSGWIAASMVGYDQDGQELLDQELVIAKADQGNVTVCRIGHHRSDEDQFDYWGEPHPVISPSGTRVLFASDWSGAQDGVSVDSYVVELPSYLDNTAIGTIASPMHGVNISPNPAKDQVLVTFDNPYNNEIIIQLFTTFGKLIKTTISRDNSCSIELKSLEPGMYFLSFIHPTHQAKISKFVKH